MAFDLNDYQYRRHPGVCYEDCSFSDVVVLRPSASGLSRPLLLKKVHQTRFQIWLISSRSSDESCNYTDKNLAIREERQNAVLNTEESDEL